MTTRSREIRRVQRMVTLPEAECRTYWGSHGCDKPRGHEGPHVCTTCYHPKDTAGYVGYPPYYGPDTRFYGEDAPSPRPFEDAP